MVANQLAKNPRSSLGQSDSFILHPKRLKKGWSLPGKSFNFGRLASTSGLSSSAASTPAWYPSYYLFGLFCLVPVIFFAILVLAHDVQKNVFFGSYQYVTGSV